MKIKDFYKTKPNFIGSFPTPFDIPTTKLKEIAFIGRSNVGKSSLINSIFSALIAKTSATPGRTQMLNFFNMQDMLMVVDLPGYGFAKAPKDIVAKWTENVNLYLKGRANLIRVFLLIDVRQSIKQIDLDMMKMLDNAAVNYQIVITKLDKVQKSVTDKVQNEILKLYTDHPAMYKTVIASSSKTGEGLVELRGEIFDLIK